MKITDKIEGYESLSAEEKLKALENFEFEEKKDNSEEFQKLKESFNRASSEAAEYKRQLKDKMTEQERLEEEKKEKDKLLESLLKEKEVANFTSNFLSVGYSEEEAKKSAEAIANGDFKTVFGNLKTFIEGIEQSARADVIKSTPKPTGKANGDSPSVTKEQFDKMEYRERVKFAEENPDLFNQYSEQ